MTPQETAQKLLNTWIDQAPDDIKQLWKKITTTIWEKKGVPMCTVQWDYFHLDIATFSIPMDGSVDVFSDQNMVWNEEGKKPLFIHQSKHPTGEKATVCEMVDEFLSGNWTPHWTCYKCRERQRGRMKPY
jgi:hypothetical protein